MKIFIVGIALLGVTRGATDMPGWLLAWSLLGATMLQVWNNPEACFPAFVRGALGRFPMFEFVVTGQIGLAALLLGFQAGQLIRPMISS